LEKLVNVEKLYLSSNKISKIENLAHFKKLSCLELGDNKIRVIENLGGLEVLSNLFLGKNKISKIQNLGCLKNLELLSLQRNRLTVMENLDELTSLNQLYISENGITEIQNLDKNIELTTLDLAQNKIKEIKNVAHLAKLEELWVLFFKLIECSLIFNFVVFLQLNDNEVEKWANIDVLVSNKELKTIYLERNPVANESGYRRKIKLTIPWIVQIDATLAGQ
jgi:protein phosphatase 1 regulatory subunit 7